MWKKTNMRNFSFNLLTVSAAIITCAATLLGTGPGPGPGLEVSELKTKIDHGQLILSTTKDIEAVEIVVKSTPPVHLWAARVDEPLVQAGGEDRTFDLRGARYFQVVSVAFSDGAVVGGTGAGLLVHARNQALNGRPISLEGIPESSQALFVYGLADLIHRKYPAMEIRVSRGGASVPFALVPPSQPVEEDTDKQDQGVTPQASGYPWFWPNSMTVYCAWNGQISKFLYDWAGNPWCTMGGTGPASSGANAQASCAPNYPYRAWIAAYVGQGTNCYSAVQTVTAYALYGPGGLGSTDKTQRFGMYANAYMTGLPNGSSSGTEIDSCGFSGPEVLSPGGGGVCH